MTRTRRRLPHRIVGLATAVLVGAAGGPLVGPAAAEPAPTPLTAPPAPKVLPSTTSQEYFDTPRDLEGCPYRTTPPAPVDESEVPRPGQAEPTPLEVPGTPAGGEDLAGCDEVLADGFEVPRDVTASAWIVSDLDTGEIVAARDAHGRYRPASLIKTLLASVVLDRLDPEELITVTDADLEGAEGSLVGVGPGGKYTVDRLLHGVLMASGNDAAVVLAHRMGGIEETVEAMNAHAADLGCADTRVATVNGLDGPGMTTSAYDMALIFRDAMSRPGFERIVATPMWGFPGYPAGEGAGPPDPANAPATYAGPTFRPDGTMVNPGFVVGNDNQLLHNYPGALGGKTGFTDDARHTFIGAAERDGRRLAAVLLDGTRVPKAPWEQAALLLDAAFEAGDADPVATLVDAPATGTTSPEHLASGPIAAPAQGEMTTVRGSVVERYGPWLAVGAAGLVVVVGAVLAARSRRR